MRWRRVTRNSPVPVYGSLALPGIRHMFAALGEPGGMEWRE